MDVTGRVMLITGGSSGVGAALAEQLAGMGARVVVNYSRSADAADAVVSRITSAGGQALTVQADVSEEADCKQLVAATIEQFGRLDVLVNNAGTTTFVPHDQLEALTEEIWLRTLRVNLIGAFMMSREAATHIGAAGGGEIIMTSSIASMTANGSSIAYCASKAGMNSLTRTLAKTLGKQKIRVNAVLPGLIDGDWAFNTWGGGDAEQYDGLKKMFADQTPLGHVVNPDDVADTIVSLITGSDYVTGQLVTLDSGFTL
jgi:3-oxoacyl-[acyl-carrier protein] reductase